MYLSVLHMRPVRVACKGLHRGFWWRSLVGGRCQLLECYNRCHTSSRLWQPHLKPGLGRDRERQPGGPAP
eukprot:scaffold7377_cov389-Prasinococcus_capsulatus_cf.AAC.25